MQDQPTEYGPDAQTYRTQCQRCGDFDWNTHSAPRAGRADRQVLMSGYIRSRNKLAVVPYFNAQLVAAVESVSMPSLRERRDLFLDYLQRSAGYSRVLVPVFFDLEIQAGTFSADADALTPLIEILEIEGLVERKKEAVTLTPRAYLTIDARKSEHAASTQGFVAMSFDKSLDPAFVEGFEPAIRAAGYRALRIDRKEHPNPISDEIMAEIRRSRFVVADYTRMNNGVYFEAGFALGRDIPVIPTCAETDMDQLHFDIRHINTLAWNTPGVGRSA